MNSLMNNGHAVFGSN